MKQPLTLAAVALMLVACSDNPVAPRPGAPAPSIAPSLNSGASSAQVDFTNVTNDMVDRLLPSFDDEAVAKSIESSMVELNAHAIAGEIEAAQAVSQAIRSMLKEGVASTLLLDVMTRTMDVVDRDLAGISATEPQLVLAN